jgi:hypothetical protein
MVTAAEEADPKSVDKEIVDPGTTREKDAGLLSILFFWWLNPLLQQGQQVILEQHHLPHMLESERTDAVSQQIETALEEEVRIVA